MLSSVELWGCSSQTRLGNSDAAIVRDAYFCEKLGNALGARLPSGLVIEIFGKLFKIMESPRAGSHPNAEGVGYYQPSGWSAATPWVNSPEFAINPERISGAHA